MADTLESIFLNTSLGATELDDGEHTLLTTNSTTSFVIKDMHVNGTSGLTNTHLELNGFNVSGITSNATGSLIIPPNSTLKLKTTDYPFTFIEQRDIMGLQNNSTILAKTYLNPDGTAVSGISQEVAHTKSSTSNNTEVQDMEFGISSTNSNRYAFFYTHDLNSSTILRGVQDTGYNHSNSEDLMYQTSYDPTAFGYNSTYGKIAVQLNGASLQYWQLNSAYAGIGAMTATIPSNFGNGNRANGSYQQTTSSYPYGFGAHDYFWYVPSSSYGNHLYFINLENGQDFRFNINTSPSAFTNMLGGQSNHLIVSYRPSDDRFIYFNINGNNIYYAVINETKTTLDAINQTTRYDVGKFAGGNFSSPVNNIEQSNINSGVAGFDINGNFIYHETGGGLVASDLTGTQVALADSASTRSFGGVSYADDNRINTRRHKRLSAAEATALSIPTPTFGIQLLGVKSTV